MRICKIENCGTKSKAKMLCMKHYMRLRAHGSPNVLLVNHNRHGGYLKKEYSSWLSMKSRCRDSRRSDYLNYGGRGIKVCDRWIQSFDNFLSDMGPRPTSQHSLDRIDVNGDYTPDNCRWATKQEQVLNRTPKPPGKSGYYGVDVPKHLNGFKASINCLQLIYIGTFDTAEEAAWMYDQWAIALHGELATLNFEYTHG